MNGLIKWSMNRWIDGLTDGMIDQLMYWCIDRWFDGLTDQLIEVHVEGRESYRDCVCEIESEDFFIVGGRSTPFEIS